MNSHVDILIRDSYLQTRRNESVLLWDSGVDDVARILMFGTMANMDLLKEHNHWFIDGTFQAAPNLFFHVFIMHALVDGSA